MNLTKGNLIFFSPTSTSKQVGEAIVQGMGLKKVSVVNVTLAHPGKIQIPKEEIVVIVVPVYGGKVAPLALERMKGIRGNNTPTVLAVVYGNRDSEDALIELATFAIHQGFVTIGAATFIGEHSFHTERYPIAPGRPDQKDLLFAEEFGQKIIKKCLDVTSWMYFFPVDVREIESPKQSFGDLSRFLHGVLKIRTSKTSPPKAPATDEERCTHCGICVHHCPAGAIIEHEEQLTQVEKCIRCCACVKSCPEQARSFPTPYAPLLSKCFSKRKNPMSLL